MVSPPSTPSHAAPRSPLSPPPRTCGWHQRALVTSQNVSIPAPDTRGQGQRQAARQQRLVLSLGSGVYRQHSGALSSRPSAGGAGDGGGTDGGARDGGGGDGGGGDGGARDQQDTGEPEPLRSSRVPNSPSSPRPPPSLSPDTPSHPTAGPQPSYPLTWGGCPSNPGPRKPRPPNPWSHLTRGPPLSLSASPDTERSQGQVHSSQAAGEGTHGHH